LKLEHLWIGDYKNLRNCDINFLEPLLLNAVIGSNGSGKSNVIEAILHILIGVYFRKAPPFSFKFQFEAQRRRVNIQSENGRVSVQVDGERVPLFHFASRLRQGSSQVNYPEVTFVYYSGDCQRVRSLINRYQNHFQRLTREPETDAYRPLFVRSSNQQAQVILLALIAHRHQSLLQRLRIRGVDNITVVLRSPKNFDPNKDEPLLWNTVGAVRRIVAAIDDSANSRESNRLSKAEPETDRPDNEDAYTETRSYHFIDRDYERKGIGQLAERLSRIGDNLYQALEHLRNRGILCSVNYRLRGEGINDLFDFDQLSEGEKQLIAVVGAITLINQNENLVLLDEPDTHLNPQWSWEYPDMLVDAFHAEQKLRSTVLMATHDPVMISGLTRQQVLLAHLSSGGESVFTYPRRDPRGQGIANILASKEFFGLPSSLDKHTQQLLDERLRISVRRRLTETDKARLKELNKQLEIITPGVSERDPEYVRFLRARHQRNQGR